MQGWVVGKGAQQHGIVWVGQNKCPKVVCPVPSQVRKGMVWGHKIILVTELHTRLGEENGQESGRWGMGRRPGQRTEQAHGITMQSMENTWEGLLKGK